MTTERSSDLPLPTYRRQRFLLKLIEAFGGSVPKPHLPLILLLADRTGHKHLGHYDFVPHPSGCYSFQAISDTEILSKSDWVIIDSDMISLSGDVWFEVDSEDMTNIRNTIETCANMRLEQLTSLVYSKYPYYATFSKETVDLDSSTLEKIDEIKGKIAARPQTDIHHRI